MRWLVLLACAFWLAPNELHAALDFDLNEPPPDEPDEPLYKPVELTRLTFSAPALTPPAVSYKQTEVAEQEPTNKRRKLRKQSSEQEQGRTESRGLFSSVWTRVRSLPAYFDFDSFARKFRRRYKAGETFLRRSIFLQKCLSIFKSRLASRLGSKSYIEDVNKFSDRTHEELKLMYMPAPPAELVRGAGGSEQIERAYRERLAQIERLNDENYKPELESRCSLNELSSSSSSSSGLALGAGSRSLLNERQTRMLIDQLYKGELTNQSYKSAILDELSGYQIERESRADLDQLGRAVQLPWPGRLSSSDVSESEEPAQDYKYPHLEPAESLDWSRHDCFHEIYDQGKNCGSCYVQASTSLAEFYKCSERGPGQRVSKRKFSKEFVLHCGQKFAPSLMGCAGGSPLDTLRFIAHSGIFNIRDWRERRTSGLAKLMEAAGGSSRNLDKLDLLCPLQDTQDTPTREWGNIRVLLNPREIPASRWKEALQDGPLVASVQMPSVGVDSYSSGVHDGEGCATSGSWHAMLLVGYGVSERGQPYWRFRNSFGRDWGDAGHFNLAMSVPGACLPGGVRVFREQLSSGSGST